MTKGKKGNGPEEEDCVTLSFIFAEARMLTKSESFNRHQKISYTGQSCSAERPETFVTFVRAHTCTYRVHSEIVERVHRANDGDDNVRHDPRNEIQSDVLKKN